MALTQIKSGAIADDAIDSSTYIDGSIDNAHLADDAVDGDKLANNIDVAGTLDVTSAATFDSTVTATTFTGNATTSSSLIGPLASGGDNTNAEQIDDKTWKRAFDGVIGTTSDGVVSNINTTMTWAGTIPANGKDVRVNYASGSSMSGGQITLNSTAVNPSSGKTSGEWADLGTFGADITSITYTRGSVNAFGGLALCAIEVDGDIILDPIECNTGATFAGEVGIGPNYESATTNASGIWLSDTGRTTFYHSSSESGNYLTCTQADGSGGSSTKASISGTGDATFSGDLVFSTAGKGVCLGVTSNTDANTLDDYEEGTWTPEFRGSTGSAGTANTGSTGIYTKIGNMVTIRVQANWTDKGSWTGSLRIYGIPFTVSSSTSEYGSTINTGYISNITYDGMLHGYGWPSKTFLRVTQTGESSNTADLLVSDTTTPGMHLSFTANYTVD